MLWKVAMNCSCHDQGELVNINEWSEQFCEGKKQLEAGEYSNLLECETCKQLWRADIEGKRSMAYAVQLDDSNNWYDFDASALIKAQMLHNRGGHGEETCQAENCDERVINGSIYCLDHLYASGARL